MYYWGKIRFIGGRTTNFHILDQKLVMDIGENVCLGKEKEYLMFELYLHMGQNIIPTPSCN